MIVTLTVAEYQAATPFTTQRTQYSGIVELPIENFVDAWFNDQLSLDDGIGHLASYQISIPGDEEFEEFNLLANPTFDNWVCDSLCIPKPYLVTTSFLGLVEHYQPLRDYLVAHNLASITDAPDLESPYVNFGNLMSHIRDLGITTVRSNFSFITKKI